MNILLIGGSGILSSEITYYLTANGHSVYMLNRGRRQSLLDEKATLIKTDVRSESVEQIHSKIADIQYDAVVDFISFHKYQLEKSLKFCEGLYHQFIFISSATVYKTKNSEIIESDKLENNDWNYAQDKIECEDYLKAYFQNKSEVYTIIRPYVTYGQTRFPYGLLPAEQWSLAYRLKNHLPVLSWDGGNAICTLTHSKEFAQGVVGLIHNTKAYNEAFHITSDFCHTWRQVIDMTGNALSVTPNIVDVATEDLIRYLPRYAHEVTGDKGRNMMFCNDKIKNAVPGFKCDIDFQEGILETINYYENNPSAKVVNYGWNGDIDWVLAKLCHSQCRKELKKSFILALRSGNRNFIKYLLHRFSIFRVLTKNS